MGRGGPGRLQDSESLRDMVKEGVTPAKLGEPPGLRVSLFYSDLAPCPLALSSSVSMGSHVRKRSQVTSESGC